MIMSENNNNFFNDKYLSEYNNFINQLKICFTGETTQIKLEELINLSNEEKLINGEKFSISVTDEYFQDFIKMKIKVFSHKTPETQIISESLFGADFSLKNLLNNQPDEIKTIIWTNLHNLYLLYELTKPPEEKNSERVSILSKLLYKPKTNVEQNNFPQFDNESKTKLKDMLGCDVNENTTDMIDDIVRSFEDMLSSSDNSNPFAGIMGLSQQISMKYANKINSGEIELDKIIKSITSKVPGMDVMMDSMMKTTSEKETKKEKIIIDENFSTADVTVGLNKPEENSLQNMNIGNMLKMADQFGVIPGGKQSESGFQMPDLSAFGKLGNIDGLNEIPNLGKIMEMMNKLGNAESNEDAEVLKQEMDTFLQNDLGVDIEKLNQSLSAVQSQMADLEEKTD